MSGVFAYVWVGGLRGIWHRECQRVLFDPKDVDEHYCGACQEVLTDEVVADER